MSNQTTMLAMRKRVNSKLSAIIEEAEQFADAVPYFGIVAGIMHETICIDSMAEIVRSAPRKLKKLGQPLPDDIESAFAPHLANFFEETMCQLISILGPEAREMYTTDFKCVPSIVRDLVVEVATMTHPDWATPTDIILAARTAIEARLWLHKPTKTHARTAEAVRVKEIALLVTAAAIGFKPSRFAIDDLDDHILKDCLVLLAMVAFSGPRAIRPDDELFEPALALFWQGHFSAKPIGSAILFSKR